MSPAAEETRLSLIVTLETTQVKKKIQASPAQLSSLAALRGAVCERLDVPDSTRLTLRYEDPKNRDRFELGNDADFRYMIEESKKKGWSVVRLSLSEAAVVPAPVPAISGAGKLSSGEKKANRRSIEGVSLAVPDSGTDSSGRKSKTIRRGGGKATPVSPRKADELFDIIPIPVVPASVIPEAASSGDSRSRSGSSGSAGSRRSSRSMSVVDSDLEIGGGGVSREALLMALKLGQVTGFSSPSNSPISPTANSAKKLTSTIRRPKNDSPKTGRSLEDFAKILSADTDEPISAKLDISAKSQIGRKKNRPQSVLLRGLSTVSISSAPHIGGKEREKKRLVHQGSLQDIVVHAGNPRSASSVFPQMSRENSATISASVARAEAIADLKRQAASLELEFPKEDLQLFFRRKKQKFHSGLEKLKKDKYSMMMSGTFSISDLNISRNIGEKCIAKTASPSAAVSSSIVVDLLRSISANSEEMETAKALCFFSPRFEGGISSLLALLRHHYAIPQLQMGVALFAHVARNVMKFFGKKSQEDAREEMDKLLSSMSTAHRAIATAKNEISAHQKSPMVGRKIMAVTGKNLDFLEIDVKEMADAIVAIDFQNFQRISVQDFAFFRWESGKKMDLESGRISYLFCCVNRWVHLGDWAASEIVTTINMRQRIVLLRKIIDLSSELFLRANFQSCFSLVSSLKSAAISRLKNTWKNLSNAAQKKWEILERICSPERHWAVYREELEKKIALRKSVSSGSSGSSGSNVILPFLGLVTQELTSLHESSPDFFPAQNSNNSNGSASVLNLQNLNLEKVQMFGKIVGRFYETLSPHSAFFSPPSPDVLSFSAKLTAPLTEEELYTKSLALEGRALDAN